MFYSFRFTKKGFTLVELLVVVAIIAILISIVVANIRSAKEKARDDRRMSDMRTLQNALGLYQINKGQYPIYDGLITGIIDSDVMSTALIGEMVIKTIPLDPINKEAGGISYIYSYKSENGSTHEIKFCLETNTIQGYTKGCDNKIKP